MDLSRPGLVEERVKSRGTPERGILGSLVMEKETHETHKKALAGGAEEDLLGSLEDIWMPGVWNHSSAASKKWQRVPR